MLVRRFDVKVIGGGGGIFGGNFSVILPVFVTLDAGLSHPVAVFIYRAAEISVIQTFLQILNLQTVFRRRNSSLRPKLLKLISRSCCLHCYPWAV